MSNGQQRPLIELEIQIDDLVADIVPPEAEAQLRRAVVVTLPASPPVPQSLTILLTGDEQLQRLNRDFLGFDQPTDVLSFPDGDLMREGGAYLGDIAISVERAQQQATAGGHNLLDELQLLTVHGVLHLLGHDHADEDEKQAMWTAQSAVLTELGLDGTLMNTDEYR